MKLFCKLINVHVWGNERQVIGQTTGSGHKVRECLSCGKQQLYCHSVGDWVDVKPTPTFDHRKA